MKKHWNDHAGKKQDFEHYVDRRKQEFDIHVASILWEKKKNNNNNNVVDYVKTKHKKIMQKIRD